jgi:hypothetical protein
VVVVEEEGSFKTEAGNQVDRATLASRGERERAQRRERERETAARRGDYIQSKTVNDDEEEVVVVVEGLSQANAINEVD